MGGLGWLTSDQNAEGGSLPAQRKPAKNMLPTRAPNRALHTRRLRADKQTTKLSSSLGLSASNSILPHSIADQLQKTKGYASKDYLPRIFGVISAEVTFESETGTFQLNIEQRLQFSVLRGVKLLEGCC